MVCRNLLYDANCNQVFIRTVNEYSAVGQEESSPLTIGGGVKGAVERLSLSNVDANNILDQGITYTHIH